LDVRVAYRDHAIICFAKERHSDEVQRTFEWRIAEQFRFHRWRPQFIFSDLKPGEIGEVRLCHVVKLFEDIEWNEAPEASRGSLAGMMCGATFWIALAFLISRVAQITFT
jgi:hypothetical protein